MTQVLKSILVMNGLNKIINKLVLLNLVLLVGPNLGGRLR